MMKKTRLFIFVAALGVLIGLLVVPVKGWAQTISTSTSAAPTGPHLSGEIVISALDNEEYLPSVAYNWKQREYLVVWHTKWAIGTRDIRAARVSEQGQVLSEFTVYEHATKDSGQPSVDYDPVNNRYLVVWVFDASGTGSDWDLYGRFIPWDGPSAGLTEFAICTWGTHQWNPKVAYGRAVEEFLVVWANEYQAGTLPMYISGRRVNANGSGFPGGNSDLTISHTTQNRVNADVTYNLARNEYLVVYDNAMDIFGIRLRGDAVPLGGGPFVIAGWPDNESSPSVAACWNADKYLVVWQSDVGSGSTNYDIYGYFVNGDGVPEHVFWIDNTTLPEIQSSVACNNGGNQFLVAYQQRWTNLKYGITARQVFPDWSMKPAFVVVPPGASTDRTNPVVAGGTANYLVAWEHQRDGTSYQDIHGMLVTPNMFFLPFIRKN